MHDVDRAPTVHPIFLVFVVRYLPLALLTPLSALCVEVVAQPQDESIEIQDRNSNIAELIKHRNQHISSSKSDLARQPDEQQLKVEISDAGVIVEVLCVAEIGQIVVGASVTLFFTAVVVEEDYE